MTLTVIADRDDVRMFDVIVIGAGIAGLHTAWRLQQRGLSVAVLEARDRVGGRLLSRAVSSAAADDVDPVDLGATWIWPEERRVTALVRELGLDTCVQHWPGQVHYDVKGGDVQAVPGGPGPPSLRVRGGVASLTDALQARLESGTVRLGSPVSRIEHRDDVTVFVEGQPGLTARHAIVALPPALAMHRITFAPALPNAVQRVASETPVWMGAIVKTVVVYPEPFWRVAGFSGTALSNAGPLQEVHDHCGSDGQPAALFGFTLVDPPAVLPPTREAVVDQLVRLFGPDAGDPVELLQHDWSGEEFTSPPGVAGLQSYELFGHPVFGEPVMGGRVHFSSCETSGSQGHIDDALGASTRAIVRITDALPV